MQKNIGFPERHENLYLMVMQATVPHYGMQK